MAAILCSWISMRGEAAAVCTIVLSAVLIHMVRQGMRIYHMSFFDEKQATNFDDLLRGRVKLPFASRRSRSITSTGSDLGEDHEQTGWDGSKRVSDTRSRARHQIPSSEV